MVFISHRTKRMQELRKGLMERRIIAAKEVQKVIQAKTPVGLTGELRKSISYDVAETFDGGEIKWGIPESVRTDQGAPYGIYVHQGTRDYKHGVQGWNEATAREFDSLIDAGDGPDSPKGAGPMRGIKPRPFLVNGLIDSKKIIEKIYSRPIN